MLSPIAWSTPPKKYGPWESMVSLLTEGLIKRGIEVTLFATADSHTKGKLHAVCPIPYEEYNGDKKLTYRRVYESMHISEVFERSKKFDIIHNHFDFPPLTYSSLVDTPVLTTIHGFSSRKVLAVYKKYNKKTFYVAISDSNRCHELDYIATIRHGIDIASFIYNEEPEDYLLFLSRLDRDKGVREAIEVAKRSGRKLKIAGFIADQEYFENEIEPHIDNEQITYEGHVTTESKRKLLSRAYALLHMINYEEAFGLGIVEALASGTPIIAINRGSMPELILDGKTGFLANNIEDAVKAVPKISTISRKKCRETAEIKFSVERMVDEYIKVYEKIIEKCKREDKRPWGYYEVLEDKPEYKVKTLVVVPQGEISLQRHSHRKEHWYIVSGKGLVTKGKDEIRVLPGDSIDLSVNEVHRIKNIDNDNLVFIEVAQGDYLGEDDIERLEDKYGRK